MYDCCPNCGAKKFDTTPEHRGHDVGRCVNCGRWSTGVEIAMGRMLYEPPVIPATEKP